MNMSDTTSKTLSSEAQTKAKISSYLKIMGVLTVLTLLEVGVVYLPLAKWLIGVIVTLLACVKAALVGYYYMHLNHETSSLKWVALSPLIIIIYAAVLIVEATTRPDSHYMNSPPRVHAGHSKDASGNSKKSIYQIWDDYEDDTEVKKLLHEERAVIKSSAMLSRPKLDEPSKASEAAKEVDKSNPANVEFWR